jgi:hypothetical protein
MPATSRETINVIAYTIITNTVPSSAVFIDFVPYGSGIWLEKEVLIFLPREVYSFFNQIESL